MVRPRTPAAAPGAAPAADAGRRTLRIPLAASPRRLHVVLIAMAIVLSLCAGRLLQLQGFDSSAYAAPATRSPGRCRCCRPAARSLDRNGLVLASTQPAVAVTADPTLTAPEGGARSPRCCRATST